MRAPDVHVHIEELILDGVAPGDRHRVADGVQRELQRLVAGTMPFAWRAERVVATARGPAVTFGQGAAPEAMGEAIAGSIHRSVSTRRGK